MTAPHWSLQHPIAFDVVVVGGGHAGCEAALAAARMGCTVAMVTSNVDRIGWMSCNPSIGGVGKSHLVAEIDAMGGEIARAADRAGVHYKLLNHSRGPAVQALRAQCDKLEYATAMRERLDAVAALRCIQGTVDALWLDGDRVRGVVTGHGVAIAARAVVLTAGTFLSAVCHTGAATEVGGRAGDGAATALGGQLRARGIRTLRHKTGTCPRVDGRSIRWEATAIDPGLTPPPSMSRTGPAPALAQMPCFATRTNRVTHEVIRAALPRSPLFSGQISGRGPRYCPSIEDKVVRFAERDQHTVFLEREGWRTQEVYLAGLSTSLPVDAQLAMVRSLEGLEQAEIVRFGYAVEYDTVDPRQLDHHLGLRGFAGLYLAGQVNGTSGYEEAAAQGLWAGIAAACWASERDPPQLDRSQAYLAVLVDDLVRSGGDEPYRMFTSRAEHRLSLRCSNADLRLGDVAAAWGLVDGAAIAALAARRQRLARATEALAVATITPTPAVLEHLAAHGLGGLGGQASLAELLRRPTATWPAVAALLPERLRAGGSDDLALSDDDAQEVTTALRYEAYEEREQVRIARLRRAEAVALPATLDYAAVHGLSFEASERLRAVNPETLGAAARVPGVTPAAVAALHVHLALRARGRGRAQSD